MIKISSYNDRKEILLSKLEELRIVPANVKVCVRLGGDLAHSDCSIQVNSVEATNNTKNKQRMKSILCSAGVRTQPALLASTSYPSILKGSSGSGGEQCRILRNAEDFRNAAREIHQFHIEPWFEHDKEFRLHCSQAEAFFCVEKIKNNPADQFITRGNHHNVQVRGSNQPRNWEEIKLACVAAVRALDLDIGAVDVGYNTRDNSFTIFEVNTNPELLENTMSAYVAKIGEIISSRLPRPVEASRPVRSEIPPEHRRRTPEIFEGLTERQKEMVLSYADFLRTQ